MYVLILLPMFYRWIKVTKWLPKVIQSNSGDAGTLRVIAATENTRLTGGKICGPHPLGDKQIGKYTLLLNLSLYPIFFVLQTEYEKAIFICICNIHTV